MSYSPSNTDLRSILMRSLLGLAVILPIVGIWWCITYRIPLLDTVKQELIITSKLEKEIMAAERKWSEKNVQEITSTLHDLEKGLLDSYESLSLWIESLNQKVMKKKVSMKYTLGVIKKNENGSPGISLLPLSITLNSTKELNIPYSTFMELLKEIVESRSGIELKSTHLTGSGAGILSLKISLLVIVSFDKELDKSN